MGWNSNNGNTTFTIPAKAVDPKEGGGFPWAVVVIVGAVVIIGGAAGVTLMKKKKK